MIITTNGNHQVFDKPQVNSHAFYTSGDLGGATATLAYKDSEDNIVLLTDGVLTIGGQFKLDHGVYRDIFVNVTGATGSTSINVETSGLL